MVSKSKLYIQLDRLEEELSEKLIPHLEDAAKGRNEFIFCAKHFVAQTSLRKHADAYTQELIDLSSKILSLRDNLGESTVGCVAERICIYCDRWGSVKDRHRNLGQELAIEFLHEIKPSQS
jgi:hypothetical protein